MTDINKKFRIKVEKAEDVYCNTSKEKNKLKEADKDLTIRNNSSKVELIEIKEEN